MKDTTLVIMAAGIGSRFGGGIKQLEPVRSDGGITMNYSIRDVIEAGFNKVIFIIRRDLEEDFKEIVRRRIEKLLPVEYAYQELQGLPVDYEVTPGETKPQGTGQAILSVKDMIDGLFLVINAGGCYGWEGFHRTHDYMAEHMGSQSGMYDICAGGSMPSSAPSDNSTVTRDVCQMDGNGFLTNMAEIYNIQMKEDGFHTTDEGSTPVTISPSQPASTNMWGLPANFIQELEEGFPTFSDSLKEGDIKSEYLLSKIIDNLVWNKKARATVLNTPDKQFGATYKEDKQAVTDVIRGLIESGVYEERLFG